MTVFLDTVGLLALWDESDQWHDQAQDCFTGLVAQKADFVTTTLVLLECGNASARRPYRSTVARLRRQMEQGGRLIVPTADDWNGAWVAYEETGLGGAGIVDQISFSVMTRLALDKVFTNDRHFRSAGFITLF